MRSLFVLASVATASLASASFELALVLQQYEPVNSIPATVITRWDPVSRTFLGQFGSGQLQGTRPIAVDPTNPGSVTNFQLNGGMVQLQRFNYSNGENLGLFTTSINSTAINDARFTASGSFLLAGTISGSTLARQYTSTGSLVRSFALPAFTNSVLAITQGADGVTYVLTRQPGTTDHKYTLTSHASGSGSISQTVVLHDNTTADLQDMTLGAGVLTIGGETFIYRFGVTANGTTLGTPFSPVGGYGVPSDVLMNGHGNSLHTMGYDSTASRTYFSTATVTNNSTGQYTYLTDTRFGAIYDAAIVVAPEPATMLALGAGIAVLVRRRRK